MVAVDKNASELDLVSDMEADMLLTVESVFEDSRVDEISIDTESEVVAEAYSDDEVEMSQVEAAKHVSHGPFLVPKIFQGDK